MTFTMTYYTVALLIALSVVCTVFCFTADKIRHIPLFYLEQKWGILEATFILLGLELLRFFFWNFESGLIDFPFISTVSRLLYLVAELALIWSYFYFRFHQSLKIFGISKNEWSHKILFGLMWIFAIRIIHFAYLWALPVGRLTTINIIDPKRAILGVIEKHIDYWGVPIGSVLLLGMLALSNIIEEIVYRGIYYSALRRVIGIIPAILISSAVFSYGHGRGFAFFIFLYGCLFAYLYEKSHSLIPPITAHIISNLFIMSYLIVIAKTNVDYKYLAVMNIMALSLLLLIACMFYAKGKKLDPIANSMQTNGS